jgi:deoxyribodipyrimidine photo-lyase
MDTAIVVFTRDLRLHDNPALHLACARARQVVPLFVLDPAIAGPARSANRARFLAESLADLRASLRERGADLVLRRGDPAAEVIRLAAEVHATAVYLADDVSHYATARRRKLERECGRHRIELTLAPGLTVVPPAELKPAGGSHYRVFTPYWRAWRAAAWRARYPVPRAIAMPPVGKTGRLPAKETASPAWLPAGRRRAAGSSPAGGGASWPATAITTTTWPATRPPGSAPT